MTELKEPILSPRFDVEDIRRLREYNSIRHSKMTPAEIVAETERETADIIERLVRNGNVRRVIS